MAGNTDKAALEARFGANGTVQASLDNYGNLILMQKIIDRTGKATGEWQQVYFDVQSDGVTWNIRNGSQIISDVKSANAKSLEALRSNLYNRGFMKKQDYQTRSESGFNAAILKAANEHSVESVQSFTINGATKFSPFTNWLSGKPAYGADGGTTNIDTEKVSTPKSETDQDINEFFVSMLGRNATEEEKQQYFNAVELAEKNAKRKATISGTTQTTVDTRLTEEDYYRIKANILKPSVIGTPLETITKGTGSIAQGVASLKEYASAYGIARTTQDLLDDVMEGMKVGGTLTSGNLEQQKAKIRTLAKARYSNLSNLIDEGVKVSDIANQFAYFKGQLLEMPDNAVSIFDTDIQTALDNKDANGKVQGGVMSITDYERLLRTDPKTKPLWLKTKKAKEEASNYAGDILRMFGLMA